jgi:biotin operon repressor
MLIAITDDTRLKMLRLLHEKETTVGALAEMVQLSEPTVSHHLGKLREAGLVTLRMAGTQRFYCTNPRGLQRFKQAVATIEIAPPVTVPSVADSRWIDALDWPEADKQTLREHTHNRQITALPGKQKKLLVILRWLASLFEENRAYTEAEVNAILSVAYAPDYVGLRRDLVDFKFLGRERDGSKYWRISGPR